MILRRCFSIVTWLLCLTASPHAMGASDADLDEIEAIRVEFAQIDRLADALGGLHEWNRDGLSARIDARALRTMTRLNRVGARLLPDSGLDSEVRRVIENLFEASLSLAIRRENTLEARAAQERELIPKFEKGAKAAIARAFMEDLDNMRMDYLDLIAEQLDVRRRAGMEIESLLQFARERISVVMENLAGQVTLDALSLDELRTHLAEDPLDDDARAGLGLVQAKQRRNLDHLERVISAAERFGLPVAEQESLLVRERGQVGVELLHGDVFRALWTDQFNSLQQSIARNGPDLLFRLLLFSVIILATWVIARLARAVVGRITRHDRLGLSVLVRETVTAVSGMVVLMAGTVIALATIGVSLGPIFAGIGVIGILVGLAVQDSLSNLAAGAMILIHRPFDVDDHIQAAGANGLVKKMNWFATTIVSFDNQVLVVPNRRIWGETIVNHTANRVRRLDVKVNIAYGEDPERVQAVLLDILNNHEHVLDKPEPLVHFTAMEDSALAMVLKPWVKTEHYWSTLWDLNHLIKKRFDAEGIEIPFPQRVVTLKQ